MAGHPLRDPRLITICVEATSFPLFASDPQECTIAARIINIPRDDFTFDRYTIGVNNGVVVGGEFRNEVKFISDSVCHIPGDQIGVLNVADSVTCRVSDVTVHGTQVNVLAIAVPMEVHPGVDRLEASHRLVVERPFEIHAPVHVSFN